MTEEEEKKLMWERLKYVKPDPIWPWGTTTVVMGRSLGKSTMAMQAFGRAMRHLRTDG